MTDPKPCYCYDCGSTEAGRHTPLCDLVGPGEKRDLPAVPGTQYWTGSRTGKQLSSK